MLQAVFSSGVTLGVIPLCGTKRIPLLHFMFYHYIDILKMIFQKQLSTLGVSQCLNVYVVRWSKVTVILKKQIYIYIY